MAKKKQPSLASGSASSGAATHAMDTDTGSRPGTGATGTTEKKVRGPNKINRELKNTLKEHSLEYFTPSIPELDEDGIPTGRLLSQFDIDRDDMNPAERVEAEIKLLNYHLPKMQASSVDITSSDASLSIEDRLALLSDYQDI